MKLIIYFRLLLLIILIIILLILVNKMIYKTASIYQHGSSLYAKENMINMDIVSDGDIKNPIILPDNVPVVAFPFKNLYDNNGKLLNVISISAPFREPEHERFYEQYKKQGLYFCGISSYLDFPDTLKNPYEGHFHEEEKHDYINMVSTWLHCFRELPDILKNSDMPKMLMTEADMKNMDTYKIDPTIKKEYDFIYVCLDDDDKCTPGWNWYNRNWDLGKKCLEIMCRQFKLRGIIVGRTNCEFTDYCTGIVKVMPIMAWDKFQIEMQKCKFIFVPNVSDASPRVITEAMCYNMPALVNYNIVGGWHNIIPGVTGEFFTNEMDIADALEKITKQTTYSPRKWYAENRSLKNSGGQFAQFLIKHYPNINNKNMPYAYVAI